MANGYNPLNDWFYLNRQTRKKGDRQSNLHYHHSYEIFIILRGSTTLLADDKLISVSKNEIVLLKPDDLHKFVAAFGVFHQIYGREDSKGDGDQER